MRNRSPLFLGAAAVALVGALPALGQAQSSKGAAANSSPAKTWTPARTPDGQPDLQGYWTNATTTPLERPKALGSKEFYTEQEMAAIDQKERERDEKALEQAGTPDIVHYDFSQFGLDRAQSKSVRSTRTSLIVGPEGTIPPLLPEARKKAAERAAFDREHSFDAAEYRPLSARCLMLTYESVPMLSAGYNNNLQIVQGRGYVAVMHEMNHSVRVIPTDGQPHLPAGVRQWRGDSRGHWDGNTLVVDVTNFTDRNPFHGSGDKLHVVERFTRVDNDTIMYRFTVEDPATWDKPWTAEAVWSKTKGPIYEFGCHEGNYGLANTLHGARVEEEAAKKASR
ncbi:MAG TPA: hypothetical protein VH639_29455 [Bryobacteraceae bacterium]|jgi:hypothetical protein